MNNYSLTSIDELSTFIGKIYDASLNNNWVGILEELREKTQSNKAFIVLQKYGCPKPLILEFSMNFDYDQKVLQDYYSRAFEDPLYLVLKDMSEGECNDLSKLININDIVRSDYYQQIFIPMKSHYAMTGILIRDSEYDGFFAVNRGPTEPPYGQSDLAFLELITPHLSRAFHIYKSLQLYKQYSAINKSILDQTDKGILVCDENNQILLANDSANLEIQHAADMKVIGSQLTLNIAAFNKRLHHCIKQCALLPNGIDTQESIMLDRANGDSLLITISPLNRKMSFVDFDYPCVLVTLNKQSAIRWLAVKQEYALTKKEIALVKSLSLKKKLNELSVENRVSYNTLRTHLQSIFRKMSINSQAELMVTLGMFRQ